MPIVYCSSVAVNPNLDVKSEYEQAVRTLKPIDIPCIYCPSTKTHAHGTYPRRPFTFHEKRELWDIHRRHCPTCRRTFALLPSILAPYARFVIHAQDLAAAKIAEGGRYEHVACHMDEHGISPSESTLRRWFLRMQEQVRFILPLLSRMLQNEAPNRHLPAWRGQVRDPSVCAYYDRLRMWGSFHSGAWNALRRIVCLFAPSVSGNRVSYGLSPG